MDSSAIAPITRHRRPKPFKLNVAEPISRLFPGRLYTKFEYPSPQIQPSPQIHAVVLSVQASSVIEQQNSSDLNSTTAHQAVEVVLRRKLAYKAEPRKIYSTEDLELLVRRGYRIAGLGHRRIRNATFRTYTIGYRSAYNNGSCPITISIQEGAAASRSDPNGPWHTFTANEAFTVKSNVYVEFLVISPSIHLLKVFHDDRGPVDLKWDLVFQSRTPRTSNNKRMAPESGDQPPKSRKRQRGSQTHRNSLSPARSVGRSPTQTSEPSELPEWSGSIPSDTTPDTSPSESGPDPEMLSVSLDRRIDYGRLCLHSKLYRSLKRQDWKCFLVDPLRRNAIKYGYLRVNVLAADLIFFSWEYQKHHAFGIIHSNSPMCLKLVRGEQHQLESRSRLPRVVSIGTYSCPEVDDLSTRCEDVWTVLHTIYVGLDRGSDLEFPFVPRRNDSPLSAEAGEFGEALTLEGPRKGFVVSGKHWNYSTIGTR